MRSTLFVGLALLAASLGLAACSSGGSTQPPLGAGAGAGSTQPARPQSCPSQYVECITLSRGAPFTQQWCLSAAGIILGDCTPAGNPTWSVSVRKVSTRKKFWGITASFHPNPGNPTELTITQEKKKMASSGGQIVYEAFTEVCQPDGGGEGCGFGPTVGIAIK